MSLIAGIPRPAMTTTRGRVVTAMGAIRSVVMVIMGTIQGDEKALGNLRKLMSVGI